MQLFVVRLLAFFVIAGSFGVAQNGDAVAQGKPKNYCQCVQSCESSKVRCERRFDDACNKTPRPANCDPASRQRCDQAAGLCSLDCSTDFRSTPC